MASSVSLLNNYNGSLFSFANKDLLLQGLMMKQGTYDLNKSRLEQLRNQVEFLDVAKQEDKEYLDSRINATDDIISKYIQNSDLSNQYLTDQLVSKLEEVVDQPILNAVMSTKTRKIEEANWNAAKERGDGSYSDLNYQVQSRNWQKYMSDGQTGSKYSGGGDFVKFVDIDKLYMSKEFNDYLKSSGINAEYIVQNGVGQFQALDKYEGTVDTNRLNQAIRSYLGEDGRKQMQINAIAQFGYGDTPESINNLRNFYNSQNQDYLNNATGRKEAIDAELRRDISSDRREYLEREKNAIENQILDAQSRNFDAEVAGENGYVDEQKFLSIGNNAYSNYKLDELFNMTYMSPIWKDRELDQVQSKMVEFAEQQRQFNLNYDLNERKFKLDVMKEGFAIDDQGNIVPMTMNGIGGSSNLSNVFVGEGVPVSVEEAPGGDIVKAAQADYQFAIDGLFNYMKDKGGWTESSTASLEKQLAATGGEFRVGDEFSVGSGRKITVNQENIKYFQKLSDAVTGQNSTIAKISNRLEEVLNYDGEGQFNWKEIYKSNQSSSTPNIYFVKSEDGKTYIAKEGLIKGANKNNLSYISNKINTKGWSSLTDTEKITANYYKTQIAPLAMKLSPSERNILQRSFYREMGGNVNYLKDAEAKANSKKPSISATYLTKDAEGVTQNITQGLGGLSRALDGGYNPETTSKPADVRLLPNLSWAKETMMTENTRRAYEVAKDSIVSTSRTLINKDRVVLSPPVSSTADSKDPENILFNSLRARVGLPAGYKGDIVLERVIKNAKPTDEFMLRVDPKEIERLVGEDLSGGAMERLSAIKVKESDLMSRGVQLATPEDTQYNTSLGSNAAKTSILPSKQGLRSGVKNSQPGTPEYYSAGVNEDLRNWEKQIQVYNPNFQIYDFIRNSPDLYNLKVTIQPTSNGYVSVFGNDPESGLPLQNLGNTIPIDVVSNMKLKGDENIYLGMKAYLSNKTGVQLY